jgi:hypothetical protein
MAASDILRQPAGEPRIKAVSAPYDRYDVEAILSALFDIRADVREIRDY